jgi:isopenicillin N synthase-like dioxygenase
MKSQHRFAPARLRRCKPYRCANQWPRDLPGLREACLAYAAALEKLALRLVPLYALALNLPETHLEEAFSSPMFKLRMTPYPPPAPAENEFGLAPHTDTSFLTLLAPNKVPGLSVRLQADAGSMRPRSRVRFSSTVATCCAAGPTSASWRRPIA